MRLRLQRLVLSQEHQKAAGLRLHSREGVLQIEAEFVRLGNLLETELRELSKVGVEFPFERPYPNDYHARGRRILFRARYRDGSVNSAAESDLILDFHLLGRLKSFGEREDPRKLEEWILVPYFDPKLAVVWTRRSEYRGPLAIEALVAQVPDKLVGYVERARPS